MNLAPSSQAYDTLGLVDIRFREMLGDLQGFCHIGQNRVIYIRLWALMRRRYLYRSSKICLFVLGNISQYLCASCVNVLWGGAAVVAYVFLVCVVCLRFFFY